MPWGVVYVRGFRSPHLVGPITLVVISLANVVMAAASLCDPAWVHGPQSIPRALPVAADGRDAISRVVTIQWRGHSGSLISMPEGTVVVTDPHPRHESPFTPAIVTISNDHPTDN
jgi:hypothetical protein